jgi:hypothetical protein
MDRRQIEMELPRAICANTKVLCGKRHKDKSCHCIGCGYNIQTTGLPLEDKKVLLAYVRY